MGPEDRQGRVLWFWVGLSVCTSPILLWIFRKKLLKRGEDKPPEEAQDKRLQLGNRDSLSMEEEGKLPEVPSAVSEVDMAWGNMGAAWAGLGGGGGLSEDSDEDF